MTAFFMLGVLLYLQGNWFFARYGIMDGTAIDWGKYKVHAVTNTLAWCIPIALACALAALGKGIPKSVIGYVSFGIVGVEVLSLLAIAGGKLAKGEYSRHGGYRFSSEGQFQLSSNHDNVLVVCADSFDGNKFPKVLEAEPELKEAFDGFTFFPDTVGTSLYSEDSIITLLTGNQFHSLNVPFAENIEKAWRNSFFDGVLREKGYTVSIYVQKGEMVSEAAASQIKNARQAGRDDFDKAGLCVTLFKMVLFKYAPHIFKRRFWYTTMDFDVYRRNVFSWSNIDFWRRLRDDGISCVPSEGNIFHFYWISGAHSPFLMTRSGEHAPPQAFKSTVGLTEDDARRRFEQTIGVARIFADIVAELKKKGVYDRTLIVFTADHGGIVRPNPLLLLKPRNSRGPMRVSMAPISMIADWAAAFNRLVRDDNVAADTVFPIPEGVARYRPFYVYEYDLSIDRRYKQISVRHYGAGEMLKPTPVPVTEYRLGQPIYLVGYDGFHIKELDLDGTPFVWSNSKHAVVPLKISDVDCNDLRLDMDVSTFNGNQSFTIHANDVVIANGSAFGRTRFSFAIPRSAIREDGALTLVFDFPDAISPHSVVGNGDVRTLALQFYSMSVSGTDRHGQTSVSQP